MRINYAETNAALRRIPVYLTNPSNTPITGAVPSGSQLQVSLSGTAWANGAGTWTEDANGVYYYQATQAEVTTNSFLFLRVAVPGANVVLFSVDIGLRVVVGTTDSTARRVPIYLVNSSGVPQTGLTVTGAAQQISLNGAAFVNAAGTTTEIGQGAYYYEATLTEVSTLGYDLIKIDKSPTALPYIYEWNVLGGTGPVVQNVTPSILSDIDPSVFLQFDVVAGGGTLTTVLPFFVIDPTTAPELVHDFTAFSPLYAPHSTRVSITNGYRYTVRRDGGWPVPPTLRIFAADSFGNVLVV